MEDSKRSRGMASGRRVSAKAKRAMAAMTVVAVVAVAASWQIGRTSNDGAVRDADLIERIAPDGVG